MKTSKFNLLKTKNISSVTYKKKLTNIKELNHKLHLICKSLPLRILVLALDKNNQKNNNKCHLKHSKVSMNSQKKINNRNSWHHLDLNQHQSNL